MKLLGAATLLLALVELSHGFAPVRPARQPLGTQLHSITDIGPEDVQGKEKDLREELNKRNSQVKDEEKYSVNDGANMEGIFAEEEEAALPATTDRSSLEAKMERLVKKRAYPLFLAEKAAEITEGVIGSIFGSKSDEGTASKTKEKIVVLGTGWGATSFLKEIDTRLYDVTVISPRNYFLFTPMLAGASVGTVEYRSITEPVREINRKVEFLEAIATDIDPKTNTVYCQSVVCEGNSCDIEDFEVTYDRLIMTVGAQTNTFGIPGVRERCSYLKSVEDARRIRTAIVNCFERANIPFLSDEEKQDSLTFAVIGAGPTGIEFAAELRDFIEEDGPKYYPNLLEHVRIKVIEAAPTVLAPFDKELQDEAIAQFTRPVNIKDPNVLRLLPPDFEMTSLYLGCSVKEVQDKTIVLNDGREMNYGLAVWAAGNGPLPITLQLIENLGEEQAAEQEVARGRVAVDPWLRVAGSNGKILSFGDCSCITREQLPATAQVAAQQGEYLAQMMNKKYDLSPAVTAEGIFPPPTRDPEKKGRSLSEAIVEFSTQSSEYAKPFQFLNLGILAYTGGGSALAQVPLTPETKSPVKGKGKLGNAVWRSVYLSKQVSWRNRLLVLNDWTTRKLFGRDITRV